MRTIRKVQTLPRRVVLDHENAGVPAVLDGRLADQHAHLSEAKTVTASGKLFIDKRGLLRLDASKVEFEKKK